MKTTRLDLPVKASWMEDNGRRLDCNPYLSGAFEARVILEKLKARKEPLQSLTLDGMNGLINAGRISRNWVNDPKHGLPFLSSTDILQADLSNVSLIAKKAARLNPKLIIHEGYTLITRSGSIGRMAYCRADMDGMACTEDVLRVVPDPDRILPGYLYAYLSSRFGVPLVVSGTYGAIIQHIEPHHIADLPVPRLGNAIEEEVHHKIAEAARLRSAYQLQVREATDQLFAAVGLKDITAAEWHKKGGDFGFVQNLGSSASLRAVNFNPRFKELCETIQSSSWRELGGICEPGTLHRAGRYKRIDSEPGYGYQLIGQRQLFWLRPEGRWVAKSAMGDDVFVKPGTTLVAARGTLGENELYCRSEFIWDAAVSMAYSEDILRVVADEEIMPRGCLFAFMRSETAFRMLRSISVGSKLQDHHYAFLPHLPVPYPKKQLQQKIHELVTDAYEKRHRSNVLEDEAVEILEAVILREVGVNR
jgi:hypothetical protein